MPGILSEHEVPHRRKAPRSIPEPSVTFLPLRRKGKHENPASILARAKEANVRLTVKSGGATRDVTLLLRDLV